jgi:hypothetical protein
MKKMGQIKNIQGMNTDDLNRELEHGGKFVIFQYCFSIVIMTFRRSSDIYFIRAGESIFKYSIGYTLLTFIVGWWGIPWGPIYTIGSIFTNLRGGKDITQEVISSFNRE